MFRVQGQNLAFTVLCVPSSLDSGPARWRVVWVLLRIPARSSTAAPKGHTAIRREECITQLDGQTLVDSTATKPLIKMEEEAGLLEVARMLGWFNPKP